jgi:hypothetical protein
MKNLIILLLWLLPLGLWAQEVEAEQPMAEDTAPPVAEFNGYIKNLQTMLFFNLGGGLDPFYQQLNFFHHRLNSRWRLGEDWRFRADLRTRVFYGDLTPGYGQLIDQGSNDFLNLSSVFLDRPSWVGHTVLDRLYLEYARGDWEVRLGRQRVNWGINTVWNPNDIFNAFAFTDFDYEERPGSDALRIKRYTGFASSIELAVRAFDDFDQAIIAGLWKFNRGTYDFQVLAGYAQQDLALGGGWAGNLGNAGLKGEFTYFHPLKPERNNAFAATLGLDYSFSNALYVNTGYLYNSEGSTGGNIASLFAFELSARNLYPYRHALFAQASYPITPLLSGGAALIYSPVEVHALFVNPVATLSIKENWDIDLVGQIVLNQEAKGYTSPIQAAFLRLKLSY